jgi:hypothetical protein
LLSEKEGAFCEIQDERSVGKFWTHLIFFILKMRSSISNYNNVLLSTLPTAWHSCFICNKEAVFQCYGCPNSSVCRACVKEAEFSPVKNSKKGFCRMCLRLVILIEENKDYNSDGVTSFLCFVAYRIKQDIGVYFLAVSSCCFLTQ